jgi:3-phenylpropionate/cinnamic acid dioxygenase small subunit
MHPMTDARDAIAKLVYGYAERVDSGDFRGVADLFTHATYRAAAGDDVVTYDGADAVLETFTTMVMLHEDGTPGTKHVTTNLVIDVDDNTATARSYFSVLQARPDLPLQVIIAGRYHDRFECVDREWRFADRLIYSDLVGDLSHHLKINPLA